MPDPKAGEVWDIDFDPRIGHEQGGIRPAIVISSDEFNALPHGLRIVVPVTGTDRGLRHQPKLDPPDGGLTKPSFAMCEQARAQSVQRFLRRRGRARADTLARVRRIVGIFIGVDDPARISPP